MEETFSTYYQHALFTLNIAGNDLGVSRISFVEKIEEPIQKNHPIAQSAYQQLAEYFNGTRKEFDLPIKWIGTPFQKDVWERVQNIPFGKTQSYEELSVQLGDKNKVRAVALANAQNPLPIVIPCHRVIGKNGKLTGYLGGLQIKHYLLQHENANGVLPLFRE